MSAAVEVRRTGSNKALLLSASILPFLMLAAPAVAQTTQQTTAPTGPALPASDQSPATAPAIDPAVEAPAVGQDIV
ncbi:MAG: hypothetical protein EOO77_43995, partial [Oxalobacteraceae bacterium]